MILVVRGDLRSETGWSRATKSLLKAVEKDFDLIVGVDVHYSEKKSVTDFDYPTVDHDAAVKLMRRIGKGVVLHATLPPEIVKYAGAINLCWWFWETDKIPADRDWLQRLNAMDAILVPSDWQARWLSKYDVKPAIFVVRWPHKSNSRNSLQGLSELELHRTWSEQEQSTFLRIDRKYFHGFLRSFTRPRLVALKQEKFSKTALPLRSLLNSFDGYYFAVQSDAPRKGLPVLMSEWKRYRKLSARNYALIIRASSLNINFDGMDIVERFMATARSACRGDMACLNSVFLLIDEQSNEVMRALYANAAAFVAPTYGEGFGGTVVEALLAGTLAVVPNHSACSELLTENYEFYYSSFAYRGALAGQLPIQPANGVWHLPKPGAICDFLLKMETLSTEDKDNILKREQAFITQLLSPSCARDVFRKAMNGTQQLKDLTQNASR